MTLLGFFTQADSLVLVAVVAIVPTTIAAVSAWRAAKQTKPNGGSSMRDSIDRIESHVVSVEHQMDRVNSRLSALEGRSPRRGDDPRDVDYRGIGGE